MITFCGSRLDSMYGLWKTYIPIEGRNNVPLFSSNLLGIVTCTNNSYKIVCLSSQGIRN